MFWSKSDAVSSRHLCTEQSIPVIGFHCRQYLKPSLSCLTWVCPYTCGWEWDRCWHCKISCSIKSKDCSLKMCFVSSFITWKIYKLCFICDRQRNFWVATHSFGNRPTVSETSSLSHKLILLSNITIAFWLTQ